jgi:hypothetical protein
VIGCCTVWKESLSTGAVTLTSPIMAFVACTESDPLSPALVAARVATLFPHLTLKPRPLQMRGDSGAFLIDFAGSIVSVLEVATPLPHEAYGPAMLTSRLWPEAAEIMEAHTRHIVVATLRPALHPGQALAKTGNALFVTAAVASLLEGAAKAVVWATGETITEAHRFEWAARSFAVQEIAPEVLVGFHWFEGLPNAENEPTRGLCTVGVAPFIGRELQFAASTQSFATMDRQMMAVCKALILHSLSLDHGSEIELPTGELVAFEARACGQRGGAVYELSVRQPVILTRVEDVPEAPVSRAVEPISRTKEPTFGKKR